MTNAAGQGYGMMHQATDKLGVLARALNNLGRVSGIEDFWGRSDCNESHPRLSAMALWISVSTDSSSSNRSWMPSLSRNGIPVAREHLEKAIMIPPFLTRR